MVVSYVKMRSNLTEVVNARRLDGMTVYRTHDYCQCMPGFNRRMAILCVDTATHIIKEVVIRCKGCAKTLEGKV